MKHYMVKLKRYKHNDCELLTITEVNDMDDTATLVEHNKRYQMFQTTFDAVDFEQATEIAELAIKDLEKWLLGGII
jgi:hypothetical protein